MGWRSTLKANLRTEVDLAAGRTNHLELRVSQCWRRLMCSQVCDAGLGERVKIIHLGKLGSLTMSPPWVSLCVGDVQKKLTPNRQAVLPSYNMVGVWVGKVSFECFHIILMYVTAMRESSRWQTRQSKEMILWFDFFYNIFMWKKTLATRVLVQWAQCSSRSRVTGKWAIASSTATTFCEGFFQNAVWESQITKGTGWMQSESYLS